MITQIKLAIHLFPNLARAYEISMISGLMIKPLCSHDYPQEKAWEDLVISGATDRLSESGEIHVVIDRPMFNDLVSLRKHETLDDILRRVEELAETPIPEKIDRPEPVRLLLKTAWERLDLSAHDYNIIFTLAKAIAKADHASAIKTEHVAEAIHYRSVNLADDSNTGYLPISIVKQILTTPES